MEEIRIDEINLRESMVVVHLGDIDILKNSIKDFGILSPPILFTNGSSLEVVDGWARLNVAKNFSMEKVKCKVIKCSLRDAFMFHLSLNIKWRGFSDGEKILIFKKFKTLGFSETETVEVWERISGERMSRNFLTECLKLYDEAPEIPRLLHSGAINLTSAKEILKFPREWRNGVLNFLIRVKGTKGEFIKFFRLLEDSFYSGKIGGIDWLENFPDLKSATQKIFEISHPYTARCMEEIRRILSELPSGFEINFPEYLSGNNVELRINFNILDGLKIPEDLDDILSKTKRVVLEGVDIQGE